MSEAVAEAAVAPAEDAGSSFEAAMAAALAAEPKPEPAAAPAVVAPVETAPAPVVAPAATTAPEAPSQAALERAAALEARETKLREAESKATAREAQLAAAEQRAAKQWEAFEANPLAHVRAMRPDLTPAQAARVAEKFYFYAMGDQAPPQHRVQQEVADVRAELSTDLGGIRAELEALRAEKQAAQAQAELSSYRTELRSGAAAVTDAPTVANLIKADPAEAEHMLFEVARQAAIESQRAGATEPVVLTATQAAAKLEVLLVAQRARYEKLYGIVPAQTQPNVQQSAPSQTITNRDASIQPARAAVDPLDDKTLRVAALKAAGLDIEAWD